MTLSKRIQSFDNEGLITGKYIDMKMHLMDKSRSENTELWKCILWKCVENASYGQVKICPIGKYIVMIVTPFLMEQLPLVCC